MFNLGNQIIELSYYLCVHFLHNHTHQRSLLITIHKTTWLRGQVIARTEEISPLEILKPDLWTKYGQELILYLAKNSVIAVY